MACPDFDVPGSEEPLRSRGRHMSDDETIPFQEIEGETEFVAPEVYAANLIEWAAERRASDLFISDAERSVTVSIRRLGRVEIVRRLARDFGRRLQGHLRAMSGSDAGEMIRPSEGRGVITTPGGMEIDLRLSSIPTLFGQDVAIRLFDPAHGSRELHELGFDAHELAVIKSLLDRPSGLILVVGPAGSGKSSTLYAALRYLNDGSRKIHTLEDPIEHALSGVMQTGINLRAGLDFSDLLPVVLRHSPDVIMIGEIRDEETAATAVRAGASGQLVLATLHAKAAAEAVELLMHYGTNAKFLAAALSGVINQRLIRCLGPECSEPLPDESEISIPDRVAQRLHGQAPVLRRAKPIEDGPPDGFTSLTCLPEILRVGEAVSDAIGRGTHAAELHAMAIEDGMMPLADAAMLRVIRGITTPAEATRVVADPRLADLVAMYRD